MHSMMRLDVLRGRVSARSSRWRVLTLSSHIGANSNGRQGAFNPGRDIRAPADYRFVDRFGVEEALVRISVGCEDEAVIVGWIETSLRAAEAAVGRQCLGEFEKPLIGANTEPVFPDEEVSTPEKC